MKLEFYKILGRGLLVAILTLSTVGGVVYHDTAVAAAGGNGGGNGGGGNGGGGNGGGGNGGGGNGGGNGGGGNGGGGSVGASAAGADGVGPGKGADASSARAGNASDTGKENAHDNSAVAMAAEAEDDDGSYGGTVSLDGSTISLGDTNPTGDDSGSYGGTDSSVDTNPNGEDDAY